jgi:transcription initiation factor TFIIF subunit beta
VELLESQVKNHYIFSERDLESYKAKNKARTEAANAGIPMSALRAKEGGGQKPHYDRRNRFQPYYRKAIPSSYLFFS